MQSRTLDQNVNLVLKKEVKLDTGNRPAQSLKFESSFILTVINDCSDENVNLRQSIRYQALFGVAPIVIGVENYSGVQASGLIIDALDASLGKPSIICVNVAPRHGEGKRWANGTPFGYFYYKNALIVTSVGSGVLSLLYKFGLVEEINILDIEEVLDSLNLESTDWEGKESDLKYKIINTQFRSYEFLPRVAKWISEGIEVPSKKYLVKTLLQDSESYTLNNSNKNIRIQETSNGINSSIDSNVWFIDNFGNCKVTLLESEVVAKNRGTGDNKYVTKWGDFRLYKRLKDVPEGEAAIVVGSSGLYSRRFCELVSQGGSFAAKFGVKVGESPFEL